LPTQSRDQAVLDRRAERVEKTRFLMQGDYADQRRKHSVCGGCGGNITPHADIDIVASNGEWKGICLECFRKGSPC